MQREPTIRMGEILPFFFPRLKRMRTMNARSDLNRRQFLGATALASTALPLAMVTNEPALSAQAKSKPKLGCVSWCFHSFSPGADPESAIDIIGGLGFAGIELIVTAPEDLKTFWTDDRIGRLRRKLERNRLLVSQFVLFQPVVEELTSCPARGARAGLGLL